MSSREPTLLPPLKGAYAALGASETYGVGAVPHTKGYAYLVARALHARHFVSLGIPGTTLHSAFDTESTNALVTRPALCTVFFGVNDVRAGVPLASFLRDLSDLVTTLRRAHARVLVIGFPNLAHIPAVARAHLGGIAQITASWDAGMRRVARQNGAAYFDLRRFTGEVVAHPGYVSADGLHPSTAGYARLAQLITATIRADGLWAGQ